MGKSIFVNWFANLLRGALKYEVKVKGDDILQSSEKTVNQVGKKRVQGDVDKTDFIIKKTEEKRALPKCTFTNKGDPKEQHYGRTFHTFPQHEWLPLSSACALTHATWGTKGGIISVRSGRATISLAT